VDEKAVRKALEAGRIELEEDGGIDAARADIMWQENTHPFKGGRRRRKAEELPASTLPPPSESDLGDAPARLAQAAEIVPELAPFVPWIDWAASQGFIALQEREELGDPLEDARDMHLLLAGLVLEYMEASGVIDEEVEDLASNVLCLPGWPEWKEYPGLKGYLNEVLQERAESRAAVLERPGPPQETSR